MTSEFFLWVGIDWGNHTHQVCVVDHQRRVLFERSVKHSGEAIGKLADDLIERADGDASKIAVSIETPHGAIIETLLERGMVAFSINPKQLDRFRDRHTIAGAKDDRRDAYVLAESLKTDTWLFRPIILGSAEIVELREVVRMHEDLKHLINIQGNRLSNQVHRYYPQLLNLGSVYKDTWLWDVFELASGPHKAKTLRREEVEKILRRHRIQRITAHQVIETLSSPPLRVAPGVVSACEQHITMLVPLLRMAISKRMECKKKLQAMLMQLCEPVSNEKGEPTHSDAAILMSFPGTGTIVGATILAEASQPIAERNLPRLRALAGVAPVTRQSGKSRYVVRRLARNAQLAEAVFHWARVGSQTESRTKEHYKRLRAAGHRHGRALRGVADRLLSTLTTLLRRGELYDPARRNHAHEAANL
jgi:transposase